MRAGGRGGGRYACQAHGGEGRHHSSRNGRPSGAARRARSRPGVAAHPPSLAHLIGAQRAGVVGVKQAKHVLQQRKVRRPAWCAPCAETQSGCRNKNPPQLCILQHQAIAAVQQQPAVCTLYRSARLPNACPPHPDLAQLTLSLLIFGLPRHGGLKLLKADGAVLRMMAGREGGWEGSVGGCTET